MEMDWKTNMAELGGAFAVSLLVLGEDNMVMMGVLLAVVMAAMAGAHVLPMFTWISAMTGDLQDTDAWIGNGMRLLFQVLGAALALLLMAEAGDVTAADSEMWGVDVWGAEDNAMDGAVMMLAAGQGTEIELIAEGKDALQALDDLTTLIENRFGEDE